MEIVVRNLETLDAEALASLLSEFIGLPTTAEQVRRRLDRSRGIEHPILAEVDGGVVGFASLRLLPYLGDDRPYAELSELFVRKDWRRRGIARALLADLESRARSAGAASWCVFVDPSNDAAASLYRTRGFTTFASGLQAWFTDDRPYRLPAETP